MSLPPEPDRPVQTVKTAIEIFEFIKDNNGASLPEITAHLGLAKSTVHRHLHTLLSERLVVENDGEYRLGMQFLDYGVHARNSNHLYRVGKDRCNQLAAETGEKVWLICMEGGKSNHLHGASGSHELTTDARTGQERSLHQLAAGKAVLASLPDEEVKAIIARYGLPSANENTITDENRLFKELEQIRSQGYAYNYGESIEGLHAVGAAIHDSDKRPIGGVSLAGPATRMQGEYFTDELPETLLSAVNEIEINLRYI